jgi:hypothetical protein
LYTIATEIQIYKVQANWLAELWLWISIKQPLTTYYRFQRWRKNLSAVLRQLSTKLIGENMFYMKAHRLSIVLPSKSKLVQLRFYTKTCFFLFFRFYYLFNQFIKNSQENFCNRKCYIPIAKDDNSNYQSTGELTL